MVPWLNITVIVIYLFIVCTPPPFTCFVVFFSLSKEEEYRDGSTMDTRQFHFFLWTKFIEFVTKCHYVHSRTHARAHTHTQTIYSTTRWASFENWNWRKQKKWNGHPTPTKARRNQHIGIDEGGGVYHLHLTQKHNCRVALLVNNFYCFAMLLSLNAISTICFRCSCPCCCQCRCCFVRVA